MNEVAFTRTLPDGRTLEAIPLTFGRGRLCLTIRPQDVGFSYDELW